MNGFGAVAESSDSGKNQPIESVEIGRATDKAHLFIGRSQVAERIADAAQVSRAVVDDADDGI